MLTESDFKKICDVIYRRCGIAMDAKRYLPLKPKIESLMSRYNYDGFRSFFHDLRFDKNSNLLQELTNIITVNETYFFREKYQFDAMTKDILPRLHSTRPLGEPFRILCAPTSTGEEAYTIALSLLEDNDIINKRDIEIIAIDIDSNVIEKANRGFYLDRSVQFVPKNLLSEYFTQKSGGYEIVDFIKDAINFKVVNVMDKLAMKKLGKFDVIFCRNMLIYFDDESRKEVAMTFYEMLKPKGCIFLGHAESMSRIVSVFRTQKSFDSIYYIKE